MQNLQIIKKITKSDSRCPFWYLILITLMVCIFIQTSLAETKITLKNNKVFSGTIVKETENYIVLNTGNSELNIYRNIILSIQKEGEKPSPLQSQTSADTVYEYVDETNTAKTVKINTSSKSSLSAPEKKPSSALTSESKTLSSQTTSSSSQSSLTQILKSPSSGNTASSIAKTEPKKSIKVEKVETGNTTSQDELSFGPLLNDSSKPAKGKGEKVKRKKAKKEKTRQYRVKSDKPRQKKAKSSKTKSVIGKKASTGLTKTSSLASASGKKSKLATYQPINNVTFHLSPGWNFTIHEEGIYSGVEFEGGIKYQNHFIGGLGQIFILEIYDRYYNKYYIYDLGAGGGALYYYEGLLKNSLFLFNFGGTIGFWHHDFGYFRDDGNYQVTEDLFFFGGPRIKFGIGTKILNLCATYSLLLGKGACHSFGAVLNIGMGYNCRVVE